MTLSRTAQSKCDYTWETGTITGSRTCVCVGVFVIHMYSVDIVPNPDEEDIIWGTTHGRHHHLTLVPRPCVQNDIFHMRAEPHLSWTVSFSTEACRSSAVLWVLCRTSLSSRSCSRVSANSPRTAWSCPSRTWTRWTQLSLSASQRWSFSSRSITGRGKEEKKDVVWLIFKTKAVQFWLQLSLQNINK